MYFQKAEQPPNIVNEAIRNYCTETKQKAETHNRTNTFTEREVIKHERNPIDRKGIPRPATSNAAELPIRSKGGEAMDTLYCIKHAVCRAIKTIVNTPPLMILAIAAIAKLTN